MPDERTRVMRRRLARRSQLVAARTRAKNEVHAIVMRRLKGRPEASDLFGKKGRAWLAELELPIEERETLDSGLRQIDAKPRRPASTPGAPYAQPPAPLTASRRRPRPRIASARSSAISATSSPTGSPK